MAEIETISILGCGWFGMALAKRLKHDGFNVKGSCTSSEKLQAISDEGIQAYIVKVEPDSDILSKDFFSSDLVVISIPPKRRNGEAAQYISKIRRIKEAIQAAGTKRAIFISSTSVYGDVNKELLESDHPEPDTESGRAMLAAEEELKSASFAVTVIRFGGLIGPGRHPGRFFAGKKNVANGKAPVNLIHLRDCIGITMAVIRERAFGLTINACSPEHPEKMEFYTRAALEAGLEVPHFIPELLSWKIVRTEVVDRLNYKIGSLNQN